MKEDISKVGPGGAGFQTLVAATKELQGFTVSVLTGDTAGDKMDVAALRQEDTLLAAIYSNDSVVGAFGDDVANMTIVDTHASGTITMTDLPTAGDTVVVNAVTYTFRAEEDVEAATDVLLGDGEEDTGDNLAAAINAVEGAGVAAVVATSDSLGVVTVKSVIDGAGNGPVVSDTGSTITISSTVKSAVTATFASAGNNDAVTINGVAFTIKTTPTDLNVHMGVKATDALQAAELVRIVNAYQSNVGDLGVTISSDGAVATIRPKTAPSGNSITLTEDADNTTVSGSGYLAGGTATGGVISDTDLTGKSVILMWYNKR